MKFLISFLLITGFVAGCKSKKKEEHDPSNYFPVLSFLQSQVKKIDTSLYSITKVETVNGVSDSTPIRREAVRALASDFLKIPDLKSEKGKIYKEVNDFDSTIGMITMTYITEEITDVPKQQVFVIRGFEGDDVVKTIYIETETSKGDSTVVKRLIWDAVDNYFQVRTITQKSNNPDRIHNLKVFWQDFESN